MVKNITSYDKYINFMNLFLKYSNYLCLVIAYVIILVGIIEGVIYLIQNAITKDDKIKILDRRTNNIIETRIKVLNSINLGLVFIIAGDVIKTIYTPEFRNILKIAVLIGIREILSIFTKEELTRLHSWQETHRTNLNLLKKVE
jgi:uncharacterized membrane protein